MHSGDAWFKISLVVILSACLGLTAYYLFVFKPASDLRLLAAVSAEDHSTTSTPVISLLASTTSAGVAAPTTSAPAAPATRSIGTAKQTTVVSGVAKTLTQAVLQQVMNRIVEVVCKGDNADALGSGTMGLINPGTPTVVTNYHVIGLTGSGINSFCTITVPSAPDYDYTTGRPYVAQVGKFDGHYPDVDAAELQIEGAPASDFGKFPLPFCDESTIQIGDKVTLIGYPTLGGTTITVTDGIISGLLHNSYGAIYKTSAQMDHGISGGIAIMNDNPCVLGIPTWGVADSANAASIGWIQSWDSIKNSGQIL